MASSGSTRGKKLMNSVSGCVDDALAGLVAVHDQLRLLADSRVVVRADFERVIQDGRVCLVSGGGSGHEPALAGFVGKGMLTAAIAGDVFASPPSIHILEALRLLRQNKAGILLVVANYTGDRLNFGLAAEQAKADGQRVETVYVADDCALVSGDKSAGRRGLSGIQLTIKIAGALAEAGKPLEEIIETLKYVSKNLGSIGLSLTACSLPGSGPNFHLADDEMELGLGVHGEAGVARIKLRSAKETVNLMLSHMTNPESASCLQLAAGDRVVLLINNLGGTSNLEMNILALEAISWLESRKVEVSRVFAAPVMTSLEMAGITLTILRVDDITLSCIDADASAPGWFTSHQVISGRVPGSVRTSSTILAAEGASSASRGVGHETSTASRLDQNGASRWRDAITAACEALIAARDLLNELDSGCGDGDCGATLGQGAQVVLTALANGSLEVAWPSNILRSLAELSQRSMGGCSGALYAIFFSAASASLAAGSSPAAWARAIHDGTGAVTKYGGAEPGDRTLLDALSGPTAVLDQWAATTDANKEKMTDNRVLLEAVASSAEKGARETAGMRASAGRASYVNATQWGRIDAGAQAVAIIFRAIANSISH